MAIGPVKFGGIIMGRTIAPTAYINPLGDSSLVSWIANENNEWVATSIVLGVAIAASSLWLLHGAVIFCKTNTITFMLALVIAGGMILLFVEGGKYDPWALDQSMFVGMMTIAYLSSAGRLFSQKDDKEGKEKDRKK